jgi:hypothetical protein
MFMLQSHGQGMSKKNEWVKSAHRILNRVGGIHSRL